MLQGLDIYCGQWPEIDRITLNVDLAEGALAPSFAAVVPVHNASATLKETLDSIIPQLETKDRLYVIENGSNDNSWELLQAYRQHTSIRLIQIPKSDASKARNIGVESAEEDYIMFCDADDLWADHKMDVYRSILSQRPHIDFACDVTVSWKGTNFESVGLLGPALFGKRLWRFPSIFAALLVRTSFFATSSTVFKRSALPQNLFSPGLTHTQDFEAWCYWARHLPNPNVVFINHPMTYYRFEAGLSKQREQRMANVYHIVRNYATCLPYHEKYKIYAIALLRLLRQSMRNHAMLAGLRICLASSPHPGIRS